VGLHGRAPSVSYLRRVDRGRCPTSSLRGDRSYIPALPSTYCSCPPLYLSAVLLSDPWAVLFVLAAAVPLSISLRFQLRAPAMAAVAQSRIQNDVHPLLRHPKPIKRDPVKAQRMLGLVADSEENAREIQRERSVTTRWLERPMYEHLEISDVDSERDDAGALPAHAKHYQPGQEAKGAEQQEEDSDADLLDRWTNPDRPISIGSQATQAIVQPKTSLATSFATKLVLPQDCPQPVLHDVQHLLSPEWTASPSSMSPKTIAGRFTSHHDPNRTLSTASSTSSSESNQQSQTWAGSTAHATSRMRAERPVSFQPQSSQALGSPRASQRPRPISFATYHQKNRSGTKIASSRGLRNNSYPNFSRPQTGIAARAIPGEHMENDTLYQRFADKEVGPPSPTSLVPEKSVPAPMQCSEHEEEMEIGKKPRNRWSTIPETFKKLAARRRSSAAANAPPTLEGTVDNVRKLNLTEENLASYEKDVCHATSILKNRLSAINLIPTPTHSPMYTDPPPQITSSSKQMAPLPLPFAPWADGPPSPAATADRRRSSGQLSLSPTRNPCLHRPSVEVVPQIRPASLYSHRSSVALSSPQDTTTHQHSPTFSASVTPRMTSRRGTPIPDPTCILCKTSKPSYEFVDRRITANCWHEPATCFPCMQAWLHNAIQMQGWDRCACPECGEAMSHEEVGAFVQLARHVR